MHRGLLEETSPSCSPRRLAVHHRSMQPRPDPTARIACFALLWRREASSPPPRHPSSFWLLALLGAQWPWAGDGAENGAACRIFCSPPWYHQISASLLFLSPSLPFRRGLCAPGLSLAELDAGPVGGSIRTFLPSVARHSAPALTVLSKSCLYSFAAGAAYWSVPHPGSRDSIDQCRITCQP